MAKKRVQILSEEHLAEVARLKVLKWTATQVNFILAFYCLEFFAVILCAIGMFTEMWFSYTETLELQTTVGNPMHYNQEWWMGISRLHVRTEYCSPYDGACSLHKDQTLYFDGSGDFEFPESFDAVLKEFMLGIQVLYAGLSINLIGMFLCSMAMWAGYYILRTSGASPSLRRLRVSTLVACSLSIASSIFGFLGVGLFIYLTKAFRDHLVDNSWIPYTGPALQTMGWSAWFVVASVAIGAFGFVFTFMSYRFVKSGVEVEPEIIAERNKRIKAWFNDVTNSTHRLESTTVDTANQTALRSPGWTKDVQTKAANIPARSNWKDDLVLEDLDVEAQFPVMGTLSPPPKTVQPANNAPSYRVITENPKAHDNLKEFDDDGNVLVFSQRKIPVTRAPKPERAREKKKGPLDVTILPGAPS